MAIKPNCLFTLEVIRSQSGVKWAKLMDCWTNHWWMILQKSIVSAYSLNCGVEWIDHLLTTFICFNITDPAIASIGQSVSEAVNTNNATPTTRRMVEENAENVRNNFTSKMFVGRPKMCQKLNSLLCNWNFTTQEDTDCRPYRSEFVNKLVELSRKRPRAETVDEPIAEKQLDRRPYQSKYLFELIAAKRRRVESVIERAAAPEEWLNTWPNYGQWNVPSPCFYIFVFNSKTLFVNFPSILLHIICLIKSTFS